MPLPENSAAPGPEELAIANERCAAVLERINTQLSPLERGSLLASLEGHTAAQTAQLLHCTPKAVENALMRARKNCAVMKCENEFGFRRFGLDI